MNSLLDDDEEDLQRADRELTLSTGVILGIFLVLVLLCGAFFGFGYKLGSHKTTLPTAAANDNPDTAAQPAADTFGGFKPSAGSPASSSAAEPAPETSGTGEASDGVTAAASRPTRTPAAVPVVNTPEQPAAAGIFVVQVAAVSHEEDAQLLVSALKAKGYPVSAHTDAADKFYHIQVGPFTNVKDAAAAKQRLIADGYQPIIK